jgi:hypothetical protein
VTDTAQTGAMIERAGSAYEGSYGIGAFGIVEMPRFS